MVGWRSANAERIRIVVTDWGEELYPDAVDEELRSEDGIPSGNPGTARVASSQWQASDSEVIGSEGHDCAAFGGRR